MDSLKVCRSSPINEQRLKLHDLLRESGDILVTIAVVVSAETDGMLTNICCKHLQVKRVRTCN